ncbi:Hypothetical protein DHA2_11487 [Giardia duodenalis]|uniref:Uncharacterized protein n=1 Tax=Giardia intestinalis TaxID=5741 RepID=V6TQQ7_GIAIN|nr:Hypothetical protein DHA2_11487 [Giardia intestinalis]
MLSLNEAKAGVGDWKNIQPVVRSAFIELYGLVEKQSTELHELKTRLAQQERATERAIEAAERRDPRFDDLDAKIREARAEILSIKTECSEMVKAKAESQLTHIIHMLSTKLDVEEYNGASAKFATRDLLDLIARRLDTEFDEVRRQADALASSLRRDIDERLADYVSQSNFDSIVSSLRTQHPQFEIVTTLMNDRLKEIATTSVTPEQLQTALQIQSEALQTTKRSLELSIDNVAEHCGDFTLKLNSHADKLANVRAAITDDLNALHAKLLDTENRVYAKFPHITQHVEELQERLASIENLSQNFKQDRFDALVKASIDTQLDKTISRLIKHEFNQYHAQFDNTLKENTAHVKDKLAKSVAKTIVKEGAKSQMEFEERFIDLEKLLVDTRLWFQSQLKEELVALSDYMEESNLKLISKLNTLDSIIHSSDAVLSLPTARWLWKGKRYSSVGGIVWSTEVCNTLQSNFIWDTGKPTILVCLAGCYRVDFVIFGKQRPTVQLHVNGEPIICAMSGDVAPYMYIKPKNQAQNTYVGQSLTDYIYLSENSKLQLIVTSDHDKSCVSGYLSLQKIW